MKHALRTTTASACLLGAWIALAGGARVASAADAPASSFFGRTRPNPLDPLRVSQADPATAAPAPTPAPKPAAAPIICTADAQCPAGTICQDGTCRAVERRISILLFQKEGPSTQFIPFYFSRTGTPGHRVFAPLYWHFWSADAKSRVVVPFYWKFQDHARQRTVLVIPPFAHTKQPDAESWAVWPLFYGSTKFGWAAPLLGSFKIARPAQQRAFGSYLFLYWWSRAPARNRDLLFPVFFSTRSPQDAFTFALPLTFYWRSGSTKNLLLPPLFFSRWHPNGATFVSPVGYRSRAEGGASRGALLWLYWYGRRSDSQYDVVLPFFWSFRSPESTTTVVPPVLHIRRQGSSFTTVFPLWWSARNDREGSNWKLLLPVYFARTREHGRIHQWLTPLGGGSRNDDTGARSVTFLVPPIIWRKDSQREFESYLLLYWRYRDLTSDSSTTVIGPFVRNDDPTGSTRVGFPLFWYFKDNASGATAHALLPFYFRRHSPDERSLAAGVFPFWAYHRGFTDGGFSAGLTPLAFFGSRRGKSHAVVPPFLFFHFKDQRSSATVQIPLFYRFASQHHSNLGVLPLLYFQGRDHRDTYKVQIPLFWRFHDGEKGITTTVVPPGYYRSRPDGWSAGLAPLIFAGGGGPRRHFVLFPLFWHLRDDTRDRSTTVVANYLHRRHGGEVTDALFPIFHYRRGARPGQADETSFTLLPFAHYRRSPDSTVFVSPVAAWSRSARRQVGAVGPYFWYRSAQVAAKGVPPLYLDITRLATGERTRIMGPWVQMDAPGSSARVLFPFYARYSEAKETGTYVFPTFFRRTTTDGYTLNSLLPLFWLSSSPGRRTTVIGPFFRTTGPDASSVGLVPLFVSASNKDRRLLATPLFYYRRNHQAGTGRLLAPLVFHRSKPDEHDTVVFPLWWSGHEKHRSHAVLFPLYWHFANAKDKTSFSLAGPLLWTRNGDWRTRGLMPLAWYSRDDKGSGTNAFLPFFYASHTPTNLMVLTAPFGFSRAPDSKWFYVGPFVYKSAWDRSFWTVFPLAFRHVNKVSETRTTVIPPLLLYHRNSPGRSLTGAALLFWRQKSITSATTLALPLFYDVHSYHDSRLTMLLPLFMRYRNEVTETTYTMTPISYRRKSPVDSTTVIFPLVWDFRSAERRTSFVFPLYAGFRRASWEGRYIFPNIWYRTGRGPAAGTSRLLVFPLWESAVKRPGDYMWEALLGLFGWERIGRNRYLKILFFPFELEPIPAAQAAWKGPRPPARTQRARGVNVSVW